MDTAWLERDTGPGPSTDALEHEIACYVGAECTLALRSTREAFRLLAHALGLCDGAEIIVPGVTSSQAVAGLRAAGARLVFADVHVGRPQKFSPKPGANPANLIGRYMRGSTN